MIKANTHELKRQLGLFPIANIVIANMIGAGIFTTSGLLMQELQNPLLMILLWFCGGIIALCGALSYGRLGAAYPAAGGDYIFLSRLYHPSVGFLTGWVSFFVGFSAPIAASAIAFVEYISRAFPGLLHPGFLPGPFETQAVKKILAVVIIALFTFIHARGIKPGIFVQNSLTLIKVGLIAGFIIIGFLLGSGSFSHLPARINLTPGFAQWKSIGLSLLWIMFAYSGWNASAYLGSEIKNPKRNITTDISIKKAIMDLYFFISHFKMDYGNFYL